MPEIDQLRLIQYVTREQSERLNGLDEEQLKTMIEIHESGGCLNSCPVCDIDRAALTFVILETLGVKADGTFDNPRSNWIAP